MTALPPSYNLYKATNISAVINNLIFIIFILKSTFIVKHN